MGIDFGQCLMDTTDERTYWMIGDISKALGEAHLVDERCHRWRIMKEKYGSYPIIKEGHRPEAVEYVFDGHGAAAQMFIDTEMNYLKPAANALDTLRHFRDQGIEVSIVAELKRTLGPIENDLVLAFLRHHDAETLFTELITPRGKVNIKSGAFDDRYLGKSKEVGDLYDVLVEDLRGKGIDPSEGVMVGDKPWTDIQPAQKRGLNAIQYTGYIDRGPCTADAVISNFNQLSRHVTALDGRGEADNN